MSTTSRQPNIYMFISSFLIVIHLVNNIVITTVIEGRKR